MSSAKIAFGFKATAETYRQPVEHFVADMSATDLQWNFFDAEVSLIIDGANIFAIESESRTVVVPLLGFATIIRKPLAALPSGGKIECSVGAYQTMRMFRNGNLLIFSWNRRSATAPFEEAVAAYQSFSNSVRATLELNVPGIEQHPDWEQMFADDNAAFA